MSILRIKKLSPRNEAKQILREVYLRIAAGERVGPAGSNGAGKTSIFRVILEQVDVAQGSATSHAAEATGVRELEAIDLALGEDPQATALDALLLRQADLFERMTDRDGWSYGLTIDTVLTKLGFHDAYRKRHCQECPLYLKASQKTRLSYPSHPSQTSMATGPSRSANSTRR